MINLMAEIYGIIIYAVAFTFESIAFVNSPFYLISNRSYLNAWMAILKGLYICFGLFR